MHTRPKLMLLAAACAGLLALTACGSNNGNSTKNANNAATATRVATAASTATNAAMPTGTTAAKTPTPAAAGSPAAAATIPPPPAKPETVHVDHVPLLNFAALYVAIDRGYFKDEGIDIDLQRVSSGTDAMPFLASGQVDVGAIGLAAAIFNSVHRGFDVKIVASAAIYPQKDIPTVLLVRKALVDSGQVKTVADLKGRKIGVAGGTGSTGAYLLVKALATGGLKYSDVNAQNLANPDMVQALANGAIDAALIGSPYSEQAVQAGSAVVLAKDFVPGAAGTAYVFSGKFLREHPDTALRFMAALLRGVRAIQGNDYLSPENLATYVKFTGSTEAAIKAAPPLVYDPNLAIATESIADQERVDRENGWTDYTDPLDISKLIDPTPQQKVVAALGKR
jgi:NitT/TauT family transport system substrate-binding protein